MDIEAFLDYKTIPYSGLDGTTAFKGTLLRLAERHAVYDLFYPFDSADTGILQNFRHAIRDILQESADQPHLQRHVSDRKVAEIAGIGHYSGVFDDPGSVHIY